MINDKIYRSYEELDNDIIRGYFLKTAIDLKLNMTDIENILSDMYYVFDEMSFKEAKDYYIYNICSWKTKY